MRIFSLGAAAAALMLAAGAGVAQEPGAWPDGYRWHEALAGESAQFGVPETDDRVLRIDCVGGQLRLSTPALEAEAPGAPLALVLNGRSHEGVAEEAGDGLNASVSLTADDPVVAGLLAGQPLTIGPEGDGGIVPGEGAAAALGPVLAACAAP